MYKGSIYYDKQLESCLYISFSVTLNEIHHVDSSDPHDLLLDNKCPIPPSLNVTYTKHDI
jgi:hypothetical protein